MSEEEQELVKKVLFEVRVVVKNCGVDRVTVTKESCEEPHLHPHCVSQRRGLVPPEIGRAPW